MLAFGEKNISYLTLATVELCFKSPLYRRIMRLIGNIRKDKNSYTPHALNQDSIVPIFLIKSAGL
jgi:hypothetical protein